MNNRQRSDLKAPNRHKHSGVGIASFVISLFGIVGLSLFILFIFRSPAPTGQASEQEAQLVVVPVILIFLLINALMGLIGLVFGIWALRKKTTSNFFGVTGLAINGLLFLVFGSAMLIIMTNGN